MGIALPRVEQHSSPMQILETVAAQACAALDIGRCAVLLPDASGIVLRCAALHLRAGTVDPAALARWRLPRAHIPALWDLLQASQEPLCFDTEQDGALLKHLGLRVPDARRSLLTPLRDADSLLGVLVLDEPGAVRGFSARDRATATALADLMAVALAHARGYERERQLRRVEAGLRAVALELARLPSLRQILHAAVGQLLAVFEASAASAWLLDDQGYLELMASSGFSDAYLAVARGQHQHSPGYPAVTTGHAIYIADRSLGGDPVGRAAAAAGLRSMVFLPMRVDGAPIGLLILAHRTQHPYPEELIAQAEGFAQQAAQAIVGARLLEARESLAAENVRLYEAEAARTRQLAALLRLSERLHAATNLESLLQEVVDAVTSTLGFRVAVLNLPADLPGRYVVRAISGATAEERVQLMGSTTEDWHRFFQPEFRYGRCYLVPPEHARAEIARDPQGYVIPKLAPAGPGEWDAYHGLFVPIGGDAADAAAILSVDEPFDRRLPSLATLAALEVFAAQAALALEKARLLETAQRRASELAGVIDSMADAVILVAPDGRRRALNAAAQALLAPGGALADADSGNLQDAEGGIPGAEALPQARALRGEAASLDLRMSAVGAQQRWLSLTAAPIRGAAGDVAGALLVVRDVSAERHLETLRRSFVATVSHELRTPLSAVIGYSELLQGHWTRLDDDRRQQMLAQILASGARLDRLVQDLLLLSQAEAGQLRVLPTALEPGPLVAQAVAEVQGRFPDRPIAVMPPSVPVTLWADPVRLQQVLSNLLSNAAKYGDRIGPIVIQWEGGADAVTFRVIDRGAGIAPDARARLFTRFGRLESSGTAAAAHPGVGLGLYICKQLVDAMHGAIWYEDTPGGGSTFAVRMPAAAPD